MRTLVVLMFLLATSLVVLPSASADESCEVRENGGGHTVGPIAPRTVDCGPCSVDLVTDGRLVKACIGKPI